MTRKYTNMLYDAIEECVLDKDTVITACLKYMSESDVQDMMRCNEMTCLECEEMNCVCEEDEE